VQAVWIRDTTASTTTLLEGMSFTEAPSGAVLTLEELFPESALRPEQGTHLKTPGFPGAPTLAQIAEAAQDRFRKDERPPLLHLHLHSDFQRSQFQHYTSATQPVRWTFHRSAHLQVPANLRMQKIRLRTEGLFEPVLELEISGDLPTAAEVQLLVQQNGQNIGSWSGTWNTEPLATKVLLGAKFKRHEPLLVRMEALDDPVTWDNERWFLPPATENLWVALVTTSGGEGLYRHGLHALKSALNAAGFFSYVATTTDDLQEFPPDLILLLADHPERISRLPKDTRPALFIPTRFEDWREFAVHESTSQPDVDRGKRSVSEASPQENPSGPEAQWRVDWRNWPEATAWQVEAVNLDLQYAKERDLWLLTTGVSSAWGPLYQQRAFADQVRGWLEQMLRRTPVQRLGTFASGSRELAELLNGNPHLRSGDYTLPLEKETPERRFVVVLPEREAQLSILSDDELARMQQHFDERSARPDIQSQVSAEHLREWLLWLVLMLVLLEVALAALRVWRPPKTTL